MLTEQQIKTNIEYLRAKEYELIRELTKTHQIVDAQRLLDALIRRSELVRLLPNS